MVLGGDFNTSRPELLAPIAQIARECDGRSYAPGDASQEVTHYTYVTAPGPAYGTYTSSKLDYLYSTDDFTGCDSWTQKADQADYRATTVPTGVSDHAPLYGYTCGGPRLSWDMHGSVDGVVADCSAYDNNGSTLGAVEWSAADGGAAVFGGTGHLATPTPPVDSRLSLSVTAWVKIAANAPTGAIAALDGSRISGFILWYEADGATWRFGMPVADADGWNVDRVIPTVPAVAGKWTHLVATYDAVSGQMALYADGALLGTAQHTSVWKAAGAFTVGRDLVNGRPNAFFHGSIRDVRLYDYPLAPAQAADPTL
ncbi:LamG domain-containing protein [Streptodolium elevatio]|uniref:LamG domain-containing protein n=1 Tax=Streptodolium elevatio TaxID=3157996 RepID=A0ABV3D9T1_9ACTN